MCLRYFYRFSELLEAVLDDFLLNGRCDVMSLLRDMSSHQNRPKQPPVFSEENHRLFSIEFQLHTSFHSTLWLPVYSPAHNWITDRSVGDVYCKLKVNCQLVRGTESDAIPPFLGDFCRLVSFQTLNPRVFQKCIFALD